MNANVNASSVTSENLMNIPWMELHIMGATLTEQAVKGNVTVCNWNTLLLSSAHKYDYICQVELRECPWSQHRHFLLQTFPIIAENSPIHSKWEGKNKSFWYYMPNLEHLLYNWLHFLRTRFKVSESKPVVHCLSVMNSWEQISKRQERCKSISALLPLLLLWVQQPQLAN